MEGADVVLENFSPDTMSKLELSAETLMEINPRLIYAAGSGYGRSGLHRDFLAMDLTVQAMSDLTRFFNSIDKSVPKIELFPLARCAIWG